MTNGFPYFYAVTAVDSTGAPGADGSTATLRRRESARVARGDGQASWNLISRNGQDVTSGIDLFSVEGGDATQRGAFVLIR